jgi:hypothetical protein
LSIFLELLAEHLSITPPLLTPSQDPLSLLSELYKMGVRGVELAWFKDYLTNRKQFVFLEGKSSSLLDILIGVPQGSILGPLLFLLYINDLPMCSDLMSILFADDTTLSAAGDDLSNLADFVNTEFQKVCEFFRSNKLSLHPDKTKFMIFTSVPRRLFVTALQ